MTCLFYCLQKKWIVPKIQPNLSIFSSSHCYVHLSIWLLIYYFTNAGLWMHLCRKYMIYELNYWTHLFIMFISRKYTEQYIQYYRIRRTIIELRLYLVEKNLCCAVEENPVPFFLDLPLHILFTKSCRSYF